MNKKTVLITGATSGIGKATARLLAREAALIITGRRQDRLDELKKELLNHGNPVTTLCFDVRHYEACEAALKSLSAEWRKVDVLINNAGLAKGLAPVDEGSLDHWNTMIDTNIKGILHMTRLISPGMKQNRSGHIINICSTAGHEVYPNGNVYCATKHAVLALTKASRYDLYKFGIRVSQISPAHVEETEFAINRFDGDKNKAKIYEDFNPLKASDVAEAIHFIINRPPNVNIQDIVLMGTQQASSTQIDRTGRKYDE